MSGTCVIPKSFTIEAVKQVVARGNSVSSVATRLGITTHSLYFWISVGMNRVADATDGI